MGGRRCIWGEHVDAWACTRVRADAALEVHGEVVEAARSTRAGTWTLSASAGSRTSSLVRRGMTTWRLACAHPPAADKKSASPAHFAGSNDVLNRSCRSYREKPHDFEF